jgi:hypothetical protein
MKHLCLPLLLCLSALNTVTAQSGRFSFGISMAPTITGNILTADKSLAPFVVEAYRNLEKTRLGFTGYLSAEYRLGSRSILQLGLGYTLTGYKSDKIGLQFPTPSPVDPTYVQYTDSYKDVFIPLSYRYYLTQKRHRWFVSGGLAPAVNISRQTTQKLSYADGRTQLRTDDITSIDLRMVNLNGLIGTGVDFALTDHLHVLFQPTFQYAFFGIAKDASLNRHPWAVGAGVVLVKQ